MTPLVVLVAAALVLVMTVGSAVVTVTTADLIGADGSVPPNQYTWRFGMPEQLTVKSTDEVLFEWGSEGSFGVHSVTVFPTKASWDACDIENPGLVDLSPAIAEGTYTLSGLKAGKTMYIACRIGSHCSSGLKVQITVTRGTPTAAPRPTSRAPSTTTTTKAPTTSSIGSCSQLRSSRAGVASAAPKCLWRKTKCVPAPTSSPTTSSPTTAAPTTKAPTTPACPTLRSPASCRAAAPQCSWNAAKRRCSATTRG